MLENGKTYTVWETLHTFSDDGEEDILIPDIEFIQSLPKPIKAIIAYYSTLIPDYLWKEDTYKAFVAALGDFSTLEKAQRKLLKGHSISTAFDKGYPVLLELKETTDAILFTCYRGWKSSVTDEFRINRNGIVSYIEVEMPEFTNTISYDRELICERYANTYTIKLNGNDIDLRHTYLDYNNIETVGINDKSKVIYIIQKNKNPEYFSPSDIDISQLQNISVKSIDEVTLLIIENGAGTYTVYDNERTKIERGAIGTVTNDLMSTDGKKYMTIVLYF